MFVLGLFSYFVLPQSLRWPLGLIDSLLWIVCGWFGLRQPIKLIFPVFIVITGLFFGQLARANAGLFMTSAVLTVLVFAAVTAYVFSSDRDFSFLRDKLSYGFWFFDCWQLAAVVCQSQLFKLAARYRRYSDFYWLVVI